jgi:HTH-type transcriptional regulator / antitoxin HipB
MAGAMKINNATDFGSAIRSKRKTRGLTQSQLAAYAGCSLMFLSDLERGKPTAELGKAITVLNTLGLDLLAIDGEVPGHEA